MRNQDSFPPTEPLSDLSEHSFGISGPKVARISWNFECYQFFLSLWAQGATVQREDKSQNRFINFISVAHLTNFFLSIPTQGFF